MIIGSRTYKRIARHVRPFIDTPETVINRALDAYAQSDHPTSSRLRIAIDATEPGSLSYAQLVNVRIDGAEIEVQSWSGLLAHMIGLVGGHNQRTEALVREITGLDVCRVSRLRYWGRPVMKHYRNVPGSSLYVRYTGATTAFKAICTLAQWLGVEVGMTVSWAINSKAAHPGQQGYAFIAADSGLLQTG
jgi:hypothetical protein